MDPIKFFDVFKSLYSKHKEDKKNGFRDFIEPVFQDFNLVHKHYLDTFVDYINNIETSVEPLTEAHPIFFKIYSDSIFSSNIRERIYSAYDNCNFEEYKSFMSSIYNYFTGSFYAFTERSKTDISETTSLQPNFINYSIYNHRTGIKNNDRNLYGSQLANIANNEHIEKARKAQAIDKARERILELQKRYRFVLDAYNILKKDLLR